MNNLIALLDASDETSALLRQVAAQRGPHSPVVKEALHLIGKAFVGARFSVGVLPDVTAELRTLSVMLREVLAAGTLPEPGLRQEAAGFRARGQTMDAILNRIGPS